MKTRKRKDAQPSTETFNETTQPLTPEPESSNGFKAKIAVPLNDDGSFDLDGMREKTREKLKHAIGSTPGLREESGTPPVEVQVFPPQVVWAMYGALGAFEAMLAQRALKIPKNVADKVFMYTPEEMHLLTPPTVRVLSKYAADWMIKYQDEIALATLLTSITVAKVNAAMQLSRVTEMPKKEEKAEQHEKEPVVQ